MQGSRYVKFAATRFGYLAAIIAVACVIPAGSHAQEFIETWENPPLTPGTSTTSLPAPWSVFTNPSGGSQQVVFPNTTTFFNSAAPLANPASGNQYLSLNGLNSAISRMSGVIIQPNTTYTLSAAIGRNKARIGSQFWSFQLWADTNGNGTFEGTVFNPNDTFIGEQFGNSGSAIMPLNGEWATNSFSFDSNTRPDLFGSELVVLIKNTGSGFTSYDNVRLSAATGVPEPGSLALFGSVILSVLPIVRRRKAL